MAGYTDYAFRSLCAEYACTDNSPVSPRFFTVTEMVSVKAMYYKDLKTYALLKPNTGSICGAQLFGNEADCFAAAAETVSDMGFGFIDINAGCPMPKIYNNGSGSALLNTPKLLGKIVSATVKASEIPVTVKMRVSENDSISTEDIARICEYNGAAAVTIHARTRAQYYSGVADRDVIKRVVEAVAIPVIGNGDIASIDNARIVREYTGCNGVMLGRAALGNPFVFSGTVPTFADIITAVKRHTDLAVADKGERVFRELRAHYAHYFKGFTGAAELRKLAVSVADYDGFNALLDTALSRYGN
jgi:tRNA-dihydrouridine synthase B